MAKMKKPFEGIPQTLAEVVAGIEYSAATGTDLCIRVDPTPEHVAKLAQLDDHSTSPNPTKKIGDKVVSDENGVIVLWLGEAQKFAMLVRCQMKGSDPKAADYIRPTCTSDLHHVHFSRTNTKLVRAARAKAKRRASRGVKVAKAATIGKIL